MSSQNITISGSSYIDISTPLGLIKDSSYYISTNLSTVFLVASLTQPLDSKYGVEISEINNNFLVTKGVETLYLRSSNPNTEVEIVVTEY